MIVEHLYSLLGMKVDQTSVKKADAMLDGIKSKLQGIALAVAPAALGAAVANLTQAVAMDADRAAKGARAIGVTTEAYQELGTAAEFAGLAQTDIDNAINKSSRAVSEAKKGNKEFQKTFRTLKLSFRELHKLAPDERFAKIAGALDKVENQADKTTLMMELMEESGPRFASFIAGGAEGIAKAREDARSLGFIISDEDAKRAEAFNDNLARIELLWKGIRNTLGAGVIEAALPLLDELVEGGKELLPELLDDLRGAEPDLRQFFRTLIDVAKTTRRVIKAMDGLSGVAKIAVTGLLSLAAATLLLTGVNVGWVASTLAAIAPYAALAAVIFLVIAAVSDLYGWVEGEDSFIEELLGPYRPDVWAEIQTGLMGVLGILILLLAVLNAPLALVLGLVAAVALLYLHWDEVIDAVSNFFLWIPDAAVRAYGKLVDVTADAMLALYEMIVGAFEDAFDWVRQAYRELVDDLAEELRVFTDPLLELKSSVEGKIDDLFGGGIVSPALDTERAVLARVNNRPQVNTTVRELNIDARGMSESEARRAVTSGLEDAQLRRAARDFHGGG